MQLIPPATSDEWAAAAYEMKKRAHRAAAPRAIQMSPAKFTAALVALTIVAGCAQVNNPWKDSSACIDAEMTTPSAEGHTGRREFGRHKQRNFVAHTVYYENGATTHWPLWWEDPFEDKGNRFTPTQDEDAPDTEFTWNWVDYLHMAYGPARFTVNTLVWPVSAIVTPPGTLMESDGRISKGLVWRDHDATRAAPNRVPPDVAADRSEPVQAD